MSTHLKIHLATNTILVGLFCPVLLPVSVVYLFRIRKAVQLGQGFTARRLTQQMNTWMHRSLYAAIVLLTLVSIYIFWQGGSLIPRLTSFY